MKKISLIVPVYNCEEYLVDCFESIVHQSIGIDNIEVIVINDGSTDNSLSIIKEYSSKHGFKIINQKNKGLSEARNAGLNICESDFIAFLDSDDILPSNSLEVLYNKILSNNSDLVIGALENFNSKGHCDNYTKKYINDTDNVNYNDNESILNLVHSAGKIYKKDVIKELRFIPNLKHEDNYFTLSLYLQNIKIDMISDIVYYHRIREGNSKSITQSLNENTFKDLITNYKQVIQENDYTAKFTLIIIKKIRNYICRFIKLKEIKDIQLYVKPFIKELIDSTNCTKMLKINMKIYYMISLFIACSYLLIKGCLK